MATHRITSDTDEMARVHVPERQGAQHRMPSSRKAMYAFILAFFGLILGWILFGIPSAFATALAYRAKKDEDVTDKFLATAAFWMGCAGMVGGAVTSFFVFNH